MQKLTLAQLSHLAKLPLPTNVDPSLLIAGFAVDSRLIKPQELFFALPGAKVDGHTFLQVAAEKKSIAAVVKSDYTGPDYGLPLIFVQDPLDTLQTLAREFLKTRPAKIVGVTGSLGKTTTKEFIKTLLSTKYRVFASPGNSNSKIGLPLAILNHMPHDAEIAVLEMGMTHSGQISKLVEIAPPDVAIITTVALVHAANFNSLQEIAESKAEIFSHPKTKTGIVARDIEHFEVVQQKGFCSKISFSTKQRDATFFLEEGTDQMRIHHRDGVVMLPVLNIPGAHNPHNLLGAIAVARTFGVDWKEIQNAIATLKLPERRLEHIERYGILFVNDSYNAAEMSVKSSLTSLPHPKAGKKRIAIIGEMPELGKFSEACHQAVGEMSLNCVDSMICLGAACGPIVSCWKQAQKPVVWCNHLREVVESLREQVDEGDVVLLKGANRIELWQVLKELDEST
ncbi:MAG: UDP-N-acetylmuramoyl-tripeptide--D-alanyl-D-alanine ligase [Parachlamydiaceae bacterium]|nr:UDP-N-acetylmuramoyl-tripeptide--D-alanyl-D-alanine ligase [Parachlamydiaceae bacterium]